MPYSGTGPWIVIREHVSACQQCQCVTSVSVSSMAVSAVSLGLYMHHNKEKPHYTTFRQETLRVNDLHIFVAILDTLHSIHPVCSALQVISPYTVCGTYCRSPLPTLSVVLQVTPLVYSTAGHPLSVVQQITSPHPVCDTAGHPLSTGLQVIPCLWYCRSPLPTLFTCPTSPRLRLLLRYYMWRLLNKEDSSADFVQWLQRSISSRNNNSNSNGEKQPTIVISDHKCCNQLPTTHTHVMRTNRLEIPEINGYG